MIDIRIDESTQLREKTNYDVVKEYKERLKEGVKFPPLKTVFDGTTHWLFDGHHRYLAMKDLGIEPEVDYIQGSQEDAQILAMGANAEHGLQRTNADKQIDGNHYKDMPIQPIEFITKNKLDWYQGNIVKYASRHHSKGGAGDLRKVIHYAELALEAQYGEKSEKLVNNKTSPLESFKRLDTEGQKEHTTRDGWIEWNGGECPVDTIVECRQRNGVTLIQQSSRLRWENRGWPHDIVAYRVMSK